MTFPRKLLIPIILIVFTIPAMRPLFNSGFFTMHDDHQVVRLIEMDTALSSGQFPVRWVKNLGFGFGYPLFNFYPPLIYYIGEIFHLSFRLSFIDSTKLVFATAFIGSAFTMYFWAKHHFGKLAGILAALFYTYAPYHALDAYVRGTLAELFSFVWLPLILLSVDRLLPEKLSKKTSASKIRWGVVLALSYALLMITHNLIALPFTFILGIYILLRSLTLKQIKPKISFLISCLQFLALGLGLSVFFWLPALAEKQFTLVDNILLTQLYTYSLHFVYPQQLWNSLWGFAGSAPGKLDGFSFKIGKLHLVLAAVVGLTSLTVSLTRKHTPHKNKFFLLATSFILLIFSAVMTTEFSSPIWNNFQPLQFLQFPWRFLTFTSLFASFLAGASIYLLQIVTKKKLIVFSVFSILTSLLFVPNLKLFQPQTYLNVTDAHYSSDEFTKWKISKTSFEFVPKDVSTRLGKESGVTEVDINRDQVASSLFTIIEGSPKVKVIEDFAHQRQLRTSSATESTIQINTFNFPGWRAFIDDQEVTIKDDNPLKLITLAVPSGEHSLLVSFTNTSIRSLANFISLTSILLLGLLSQPKLHKILKKLT